MLMMLTMTALYAYSSPEEVLSQPPSAYEERTWQEVSPTSESVYSEKNNEEVAPASEQTGSATRERTFYKYGEVKTVTPAEEEETVLTLPEGSMPIDGTETSDVVIAEPVGDAVPSEPEPLPLSEEELLVPNLPAPEIKGESAWQMPSVPMPLLLAGGVALLGMIAYWIWRIVPRFKTTMSKEAISPPPADLKSLDVNQMERLKTALGENKD